MSQKALTLSIVIPVFNEQRYIKACLDSIAAQTVKPDEVIVVNNNSADKTVEIAKKYKHVRVVKEPVQGVYFARKKGFNETKSDVIGRIDADTILPKDWVEMVRNHFADESVAAITGSVRYYDIPMQKLVSLIDKSMRSLFFKLAPSSPFLYGSNMAISKRAWNNVSPYECSERNIHEDIDLAIHLYEQGQKIVYDKKILVRASCRRINEKPREYLQYIWMYRQNFRRHNLHSFIAYGAIVMWTLGYCLFHPWRNIWYRLYSKFNNSPYPITRESRKNPMKN